MSNYREERRRSRSRDRDGSADNRGGREINNRHNHSNFSRESNDRYRDQQGGNNNCYGERDKRDRDSYSRNNDRDNNYSQKNNYSEKSSSVDESKTIMLKGLPSHTTEPSLYAALAPYQPLEIRLIAQRDTGDCKGFAFVEFYSIEHASYFIASFAGSAGDPNAPQLIIDNRAVVLDYARDRDKERGPRYGSAPSTVDERKPVVKSDWICEKCSGQNFARRTECYRCSAPKTDTCVTLSSGPGNHSSTGASGDSFTETVVSTQTPNCYLVVRGLPPYVSEEQVTELFRQYAPVKGVLVIRDRVTTMSRGVALVEFQTVEHCSHALYHAEVAKLSVDHGGPPLKISYAKPSFVTQQVTQLQEFEQLQQQLEMQQAMLAYGSVANAAWTTSLVPITPSVPVPLNVSAGYYPPVISEPLNQSSPQSRTFYPPNFETNGGVYTFQPQSGYFYDSLSEFYYCPKSKLYYNSKDGTYYRYEAGVDPPYVRFTPPQPSEVQLTFSNAAIGTTSTDDTTTTQLDANAIAAAALARKPVIISMGLAPGKQKVGKPIVPNKKVIDNIAKWESAQETEESGTNSEGNGSADPGPTQASPSVSSLAQRSRADSSVITTKSVPSSIPPTSAISAATIIPPVSSTVATNSTTTSTGAAPSGSAVCLLCRRQFASSEQLLRHERESKLHAENLEKQALSVQESSASSSVQYRDRASERRAIQGDSIAPGTRQLIDTEPTRKRRQSFDTSSVPVDKPAQSLIKDDESNPGNQLLRKMGWSEGQGLGKDQIGIENPIEAVNRSNTKAGIGIGAADSSLPPLVYGPGSSYKESLLRAAKARYDQIGK